MALTRDQVSLLYEHIDRVVARTIDRERAERSHDEAMRLLRYFVSQQTKVTDGAGT